MNGRSVKLYPESVAEVVKAGHEVAAHAYAQNQYLFYMTQEEERETSDCEMQHHIHEADAHGSDNLTGGGQRGHV